MLSFIKNQLALIESNSQVSSLVFRQGQALYINGLVTILSQAANRFEMSVDDAFKDFVVTLLIDQANEQVTLKCNCGAKEMCSHRIAALTQLAEELSRNEPVDHTIGKAYTREGMIKRVLEERQAKANNAEYKVEFSDNIHGEHLLITEKATKYQLTLRDLKEKTGYCSCPDYASNKLGTCKHLMYAYLQLEKSNIAAKSADSYPFVEVYLDPLNDYQISWYYPDEDDLVEELRAMIDYYFEGESHLPESKYDEFLTFLEQARGYKQILVRPEVEAKVEKYYNQKMLISIQEQEELDFSPIKATLYPYQKRGVEFATFREGVIIADEMGLGKTLQALSAAIMKKKIFGFTKTLIICPASLKDQWKKEIEKFSDEKAVVVQGKPEEREEIYANSDAFFVIINYETTLRDQQAINRMDPDFIILDEAQRIKNYTTRTASAVKALRRKHALVITGTPIENRLIDLFSIMDFVEPEFLTPLWEFSYQHCYFDEQKKNRISGYYNLQNLKERIKPFLLRRQKRDVIKELPTVQEFDVPVGMHRQQAEYHASYAQGVAKIIRKKVLTPYDLQRLQLLLANMRMVCDSTFLIDKETHFSPKLEELKHILTEKLDVKNSKRKVIIFSEWVKMLGLIGKMLREIGIGYTELTGKVPIKKRQALVEKFFEDEDCQVFLSTESGGSGLNLQVADTVINFELPWNPAKKNQRIGRIDRLGQRNEKLTVINLVTQNSIETRIATGIILKQSLFDGVLDERSRLDVVDFSSKGRSQFLQQIEAMMEEMSEPGPAPAFEEEEIVEERADEVLAELAQEEEEESLSLSTSKSTSGEEPQPAAQVQAAAQPQPQQMQQVMAHGLNFLSSLMKMTTGQELGTDGSSVEIDEKTGEVVMRFKMPGM